MQTSFSLSALRSSSDIAGAPGCGECFQAVLAVWHDLVLMRAIVACEFMGAGFGEVFLARYLCGNNNQSFITACRSALNLHSRHSPAKRPLGLRCFIFHNSQNQSVSEMGFGHMLTDTVDNSFCLQQFFFHLLNHQ